MKDPTDDIPDFLKDMVGIKKDQENEYVRKIRELNEKIQSKK